MEGPVVILLWTRLRRMAARFSVLAARLRAGTLRTPTRTRPCTASLFPTTSAMPANPPDKAPACKTHSGTPSHSGSSKREHEGPSLPSDFGWLVRLLPETACYRSQLLHLMSDPEFPALLSRAPVVARMLRPLCHKLAIRLPKGGFASNPVRPAQVPKSVEPSGPEIRTRLANAWRSANTAPCQPPPGPVPLDPDPPAKA